MTVILVSAPKMADFAQDAVDTLLSPARSIKEFFADVGQSGNGRAVMMLAGGAIAVATINSMMLKKNKGAAAGAAAPADAKKVAGGGTDAKKAKKKPRMALSADAKAVLKAAMTNNAMPKFYAVVLGGAVVGRLLVDIKLQRMIGALGSMLANGEFGELTEAQATYALWGIPVFALKSLITFARDRLALSLRDGVMNDVSQNLGNSGDGHNLVRLRRLGVEHPDQRLTEEVKVMCAEYATLWEGLCKPLSDVVLTSYSLSVLMGPANLLSFYGFFIGVSFWTRRVGPSFATLIGELQDAEAQLKARHAHVSEYGEEIEMMGGGAFYCLRFALGCLPLTNS